MKKALKVSLLLLLLYFTVACSVQENMQDIHCGNGDIADALCDTVFGHKNVDQDKQITALKQRVDALQASLNLNIAQISALQSLSSTQSSTSQSLQTLITSMQQTINAQTVQLAALSSNQTVVALIDFCGPAPGFNEVGMRMSDGSTVAYFESGSRRFLSKLTPGSYSTTDGTSCNFTVNSTGKICDNLGCR